MKIFSAQARDLLISEDTPSGATSWPLIGAEGSTLYVKSLRLATKKFIEFPEDIDDGYVNRFIGGLWKCAS